AKSHAADGSRHKATAVASAKTPAVESTVKAPAPKPTVKTPAVEPAPKETPVESTAKPDVPDAAPVTITGCLELDEQRFWLKDASGVGAPKSRSWRSGFLKKRSSPIELVAATSTLNLPGYVGQRVAATGMLLNGEMRARSLQRVAASCN
ncbi:MAG: hypothetical protein ACREUZ_19845, partial [Burkholderiales bacterium]